MAKRCKGCYYYRALSHTKTSKDWACHYLLITGEPRGCDPAECDKRLVVSDAKRREMDEPHRRNAFFNADW